MRKIGLKIPRKKKKKRNFQQIARKLLKFLRLMKKLQVTLTDLTKQPIFPTRPYMLPGSKQFLVSVNLGQEFTVKEMLKKNRFLVFQIDSVKKIKLFFQGWKISFAQSSQKIKFRNGKTSPRILPRYQFMRFLW